MPNKLLTLLTLIALNFLSIRGQNSCSNYFKYLQTQDDVQGTIELPVELRNSEHRIKIQLSVASQITVCKGILSRFPITDGTSHC